MRFLIFFLIFVISPKPQTQMTKVYNDRYSHFDNLKYLFDGNHIYQGFYNTSSNVIYTVKDGKIYSGRYPHDSEIVMTFDDKYIYRGKYRYASEIRYTYENGKIYRGRFAQSSEQVFNFDGDYLYAGRFQYSSNVQFKVEGKIPIPVLMCILLTPSNNFPW